MDESYKAVVGLEIHAQLLTNTKLFCGCLNRFGSEPNSNVCPVCLGLPGALPVVNREAVRQGAAAALALGCRINGRSAFARKNYFYPDLPKGYQITQYEEPLSIDGGLPVRTSAGEKTFRIRRLHLEEDAGKTIHDAASSRSLIDLNRCGVPLVEIVGEPVVSDPEEAAESFKAVRRALMYLGICDGNMQEGSLRCDLNVSVRKRGTDGLGTKVELKNLGSFRYVRKALEHEFERQVAVLRRGGTITSETRQWIEKEGRTRPVRIKEKAPDYRYFPEPDLPPLVLDPAWLEEIRAQLPELPWERENRLAGQYGIGRYAAQVLCSHRRIADYFEEVAEKVKDAGRAGNFIMTQVFKDADGDGIRVTFPVSADFSAQIVSLLEDGRITGAVARRVLDKSMKTGQEPANIVRIEGLEKISDEEGIKEMCRQALERSPAEAKKLRQGKRALMRYFIGQVLNISRGKADPGTVKRVLAGLLHE